MEQIVSRYLSPLLIRKILISVALPVIVISLVGLLVQLVGCFQLLLLGSWMQFIVGSATAFMFAGLTICAALFFLIVADTIRPIWSDNGS